MLITDPAALAGLFDWSVRAIALPTNQTKLAPGDSTRVYIAFVIGSAAGEAWIAPVPNVGQAVGFHINGTPNEVLEFHYSRHGSMVGGEWWGIALGVDTIVSVIEVVYRPRLILPRSSG